MMWNPAVPVLVACGIMDDDFICLEVMGMFSNFNDNLRGCRERCENLTWKEN